MEGKRTDPTLESKWFRVQAAGMKNADPETAEILRQIGDKLGHSNGSGKDSGETRTADSNRQRRDVGNAGSGRRVQSKELSGRLSKARTDAVENNGDALAGGVHGVSKGVLENDRQIRTPIENGETAKFSKERISEVRKRLKTASNKAKQAGTKKPAALFSRKPSKEDVEFDHDFLVQLSDVDELFRHAISHKTSMKGVFEDVYPKAKYLGEDMLEGALVRGLDSHGLAGAVQTGGPPSWLGPDVNALSALYALHHQAIDS
jgi:hypothetical protein